MLDADRSSGHSKFVTTALVPSAVLIDYGCHSFTYRLAGRLSEDGFPVAYFANGSLESPNLASLAQWEIEKPALVRNIKCQRPYGKMSLAQRLRGELKWASHCIRALENERPQVIIGSCIPLAAVTRIHSWARRKKIPFVYWLQDLQGRAMHDLLGRKFGLAGRAIGGLTHIWEQHILEHSAVIINIAADHERELPITVRTENRHALLENWADIEEFPTYPADNDWASRHGLAQTDNIIYSGTLGLKHDLQMFYGLAEALKSRPNARLVIVSSGQAAETVTEEAARRQLTNLLVLPFQPYTEVPQVLASAAVLIAPMDTSAGGFCIPSKILSYLCAGRPTVIAIDESNPAAHTIRQTGSGTVVRPGDAPGFVAAVCAFLDDPATRLATGHRARAYAEATFALDTVVPKFLSIIARAGTPLLPAPLATSPAALARSTSVSL